MTVTADRLSALPSAAGATPHQPASLYERILVFYRAYTRAAAGGDIASWPGFLTEDAVFWVNSRANVEAGRRLPVLLCDGRAMAEDRAATILGTQVFVPRRLRYLLSGLCITGQSGNRLFTEADFAVTQTLEGGAPQLVMTGQYQDEIVLLPRSRLLFRQHTATYDNDVIAGELVYPL